MMDLRESTFQGAGRVISTIFSLQKAERRRAYLLRSYMIMRRPFSIGERLQRSFMTARLSISSPATMNTIAT